MKSKKLGLASAVFVVALLAGEALVRWSSTPAFSFESARESARQVVARMRGGEWAPGDSASATDGEPAPLPDDYPEHLLHAYVGFDTGGSDDLCAAELALFAEPEAAERIDVLVLGGSVAAGFGKDCNRQLKRGLEDAPQWRGREVRVFNAGRGGFRQPQLLHLFEYLYAIGYRPDIVIEIDGFNEVALGLANARAGVHPVMPSISHWTHLASDAPLGPRALDAIAAVRNEQHAAQRVFERAETLGLFHSVVGARIVQARLDASYARFAAASEAFAASREVQGQRSYLVGPAFAGGDAAALDAAVEIWFQSSVALSAVCKEFGARYLQVLQPTLHDAGSKPLTENERKKGAEPLVWAEGARLGYPKLRARGAELAQHGVEFLDLSQAFAAVTDELYYDVCHFAPAGNRMLAVPILAALEALPPPPPRPAR